MAETLNIYQKIENVRNIIETTHSPQLRRDQAKYLKRLYNELNEIRKGDHIASRKTEKGI